MSNIYPIAKRKLMEGALNLTTTSALKIALCKTGFTYDGTLTDATAFLGGALLVGTPVTLTTPTVSNTGGGTPNAVFDADDPTFTAVAALGGGDVIVGALIYKDDVNKWPIMFIDTGTGLPITPNGGNITLNFSATASRVFAL